MIDVIAEIITLRAIALKPLKRSERRRKTSAEIITLRAIALKLPVRDSYIDVSILAEIITLRAIALKRSLGVSQYSTRLQRS